MSDEKSGDEKSRKEELARARRLLGRVLGGGGVIFLLAAAYFGLSGEIQLGGSQTSMEIRRTITVAENPGEYWSVLAFTALIGCGLIVTALKVRRS